MKARTRRTKWKYKRLQMKVEKEVLINEISYLVKKLDGLLSDIEKETLLSNETKQTFDDMMGKPLEQLEKIKIA